MTNSLSPSPSTPAVVPPPKLQWLKIIVLSTCLAISLTILLLLISGGILGWLGWRWLNTELTARQLELSPAITAVKTGWHQTPVTDQGHQNWLILGTDSLPTRGAIPPLTDTMILASFDTNTQQVHLLSLPRDLWLDGVDTKINALYAYGQQKKPDQPTELVTQTLSEATGLPIHHTLVISLTQLEQLIDLVGGIDITVPEGFTDPLFPRPDVDVRTVHDPKKLFETVTFTAGLQHMSGATALKYIRSRHSQGVEGTDTARGQRQQLVIEALVHQLADVSQYKKTPTKALDLWQWYEQNFAGTISLSELVSLAKPMVQTHQLPQLLPAQLSIATLDKRTGKMIEPGVLVNPPINPSKYQGQWVYILRDLAAFKVEVKQKLYGQD
jgi:LCP family protein required for cell wall assembly